MDWIKNVLFWELRDKENHTKKKRIHTCNMYHNLFNYRPFALLAIYSVRSSVRMFFYQYISKCNACRWFRSFTFSFLFHPCYFFSWVCKIDSKKQSNRNRCCLNNSRQYSICLMCVYVYLYALFIESSQILFSFERKTRCTKSPR